MDKNDISVRKLNELNALGEHKKQWGIQMGFYISTVFSPSEVSGEDKMRVMDVGWVGWWLRFVRLKSPTFLSTSE